jgi:hypothetical protein
MQLLEYLDLTQWEQPCPGDLQDRATEALEHGCVLYCPGLTFALADTERRFLSAAWRDGHRKSISYEAATGRLGGTAVEGEEARALAGMMARYARVTRRLLESLLPAYAPVLSQARTSFRPAVIDTRPRSYKQDDRLLHVDAFPSRPTRGARILRVFTNVNPEGRDRLWRVGEPFEDMARRFLASVRRPVPGVHALLAALGITKGMRTAYDHVMLQLHARVKADLPYQEDAPQTPAGVPRGQHVARIHGSGPARGAGGAIRLRADLPSARLGAAPARPVAAAHPRAPERPPTGSPGATPLGRIVLELVVGGVGRPDAVTASSPTVLASASALALLCGARPASVGPHTVSGPRAERSAPRSSS